LSWRILKGKIVVSTSEVLKLIEEAEVATKKETGRPRGRPRKCAFKGPVVILEEAKNEEETPDDDSGNGGEVNA